MNENNTKSSDTNKTRLFIADDHPVVLDGIKMTFEREPGFEKVFNAELRSLNLSV